MNRLTSVQQKFILHWGEMGTRWGINRTVAQTHALLFISPRPLNADDIVETLGVARSNVSTSLKELQSWGIVKMIHILGDKRDHFETQPIPGPLSRGLEFLPHWMLSGGVLFNFLAELIAPWVAF